ncbi:MAG TPA: GDSL-type esterase/lipase family protein [Coleofasciculaceae cyanobacterium]
MNTPSLIAFLSSLLFNILVLGGGSIWIYQKGGIPYLIQKIYSLQNPESRLKSMYDNPYYWDKKSIFDTLPESEAEIVFLGDSLTDYCEWQEFFRSIRIKNRGISGDTTEGILNRIDEIIQSRPTKIFIMIGINDINQGRQVEDIFNSYEKILTKLRSQTPETSVFIQSLLPVNNRLFPNNLVNQKVILLNEKLRELTQKSSFQYIDLFPYFLDSNQELDARYTTDGVHVNGQGYLLWKKIIEKDVLSSSPA